MEASGSSETVVPTYWMTQHHITKDCNLKPSRIFLWKVCCIKMCIKQVKMESDMKAEFQHVDVPFKCKKVVWSLDAKIYKVNFLLAKTAYISLHFSLSLLHYTNLSLSKLFWFLHMWKFSDYIHISGGNSGLFATCSENKCAYIVSCGTDLVYIYKLRLMSSGLWLHLIQ